MKAATCTPIDFKADAHFFGRDSGLLCRGFQSIGVECISIMPGSAIPGDAPDLRRASERELRDASWWEALDLDLVVLYAWGDPRFRAIAEAIRNAGILLIQSLDTAGLSTPYGNFQEWWRRTLGMWFVPQPFSQRMRLIAKVFRDAVPFAYEHKRLEMIDTSDQVATVSPPARDSVRNYASALGFSGIVRKLTVIPHPVPSIMTYDGRDKSDIILIVGRWEAADAGQKDPGMLLAVLKKFLAMHPGWVAEIVGRGSERIRENCGNWDKDSLAKLILTPALPREALLEKYQASKILFCPSRYESYHISSAEAVCCGCSVVVAKHPLLASTAWFTQDNCGTLADQRTVKSLAYALGTEATHWEQGNRQPWANSEIWQKRLHADNVARCLAANVLNGVPVARF
jgi:glycosyltransferase involved in cell wall biosynthesis